MKAILHRMSGWMNFQLAFWLFTLMVLLKADCIGWNCPVPPPKAPPANELPPLEVLGEREIARQDEPEVPEKARALFRVAQYRVVTEDVRADDPSMSEVRRLMYGDRPAPRQEPMDVDGGERRSSMPIAAPVVIHRAPTKHVREEYRPPVRRVAPPPYCPPHMRRHVRRGGPPPRRYIRLQDRIRERAGFRYYTTNPVNTLPGTHFRPYGAVPPWVVAR